MIKTVKFLTYIQKADQSAALLPTKNPCSTSFHRLQDIVKSFSRLQNIFSKIFEKIDSTHVERCVNIIIANFRPIKVAFTRIIFRISR